MSEVSRVVDAENHIGESPTWSASEQALWWINCEQEPTIFRWVPATDELRSWPMPMRIGGLVVKASGGLLVALADGVYDFTPQTGNLELRAPSPLSAHVKLHECGCDRQGRFWTGSFDHRFPADRSAAGGVWFRLDGDTLVPVIEGIAVANGLAFSPDGRTMYTADTPRRTVDAYDLDPVSGALSNARTFLSLAPGDGHIDGATVDAEGGYWLAVVGRSAIRRFLPNGRLDREIALPFSNPTKPVFAGERLGSMFITSTRLQIAPQQPGSAGNGGLYRANPGAVGIAEALFAH